MLIIKCPWCGPRDELEFTYGGEAHIHRPSNPNDVSDKEWANYLFMRKNPKGIHSEQWCHSSGCRQWFYAERDTVTYEITNVYTTNEHNPGAKN